MRSDDKNIYNHLKNQIDNMSMSEVNSKLKKSGIILWMCGRPERSEGKEGIINNDDILNLSIALNTAKDLDEFLELV